MAAALPLDKQLCFSLYAASMAMTRAYKPMLDELGITYPQYLVLLALWDRDGVTVGAIAERLTLESSTITPLLKRLEAAGFVERRRNPQDERQIRVTLTAKGRDMRETCGCLSESVIPHLTLPPERLAALKRDADALRACLVAGTGQTGTGGGA